jgi:xanthine dehydrogenase accessory factor
MLVARDTAAGTIGGGHLELKAIEAARTMLADGERSSRSRHFPLGPALGQCCGGAVTLAAGLVPFRIQRCMRRPLPASPVYIRFFESIAIMWARMNSPD